MTTLLEKYRKMSDSELTAAVRAGNDRAFNALFLRWFPQVAKFLHALVKERTLAEDLAQGVFMKVWIHRESLDPGKSLKNYLLVLARNAALDVFKSKRHLVMADMASPPQDKCAPEHTEFGLEYGETHSRIVQIVQQMPPQRQEVFRLSRQDELSHEEIATRLGLSVRTVEKHIQLALQDLRKNFS